VNKSIHITFLTVYLFFSVGFTVAIHYCGGNVNSVSIATTGTDEPEDCCGTSCESDCCSTKTISLKLEDNQKIDAQKILDNLQSSSIPRIISYNDQLEFANIIDPATIAFSPPGTAAYITNRNLRI